MVMVADADDWTVTIQISIAQLRKPINGPKIM